MTTRLKNIAQTVGIVLILMLFPGTAYLQEQKADPAPPDKVVSPVEEIAPSPESAVIEPVPAEAAAEPVETTPAKPESAAVEPVPAETAAEAVAITPIKMETVEATPPTPAAEEFTSYIIKKGDTLWDISNTFLKDPFLWPFIWKANPYINNPDLIYPGNKLGIPSLAPIEQALDSEQAPAKPADKIAPLVEKPVAQKAVVDEPAVSPKPVAAEVAAEVEIPAEEIPAEENGKRVRISLPEEQTYPIIDKYAMLSMGFVDGEETDDRIVGSPETGKTIFGYDDIVYVSINDKEKVNIGDKYFILTSLHKVKHPKTGKSFGTLIKGLGILQVTAVDPSADVLTARITLSFDMVEKGNMLAPYQEPLPIYHSAQKKAKDISGYILEVTDKRSINAQTDVVYLDKGIADGVEPGDRFSVYAEPDKKGFPRKVIGEVQVLIVKQQTSTAIVQKGSEAMGKGNAVDFKR